MVVETTGKQEFISWFEISHLEGDPSIALLKRTAYIVYKYSVTYFLFSTVIKTHTQTWKNNLLSA